MSVTGIRLIDAPAWLPVYRGLSESADDLPVRQLAAPEVRFALLPNEPHPNLATVVRHLVRHLVRHRCTAKSVIATEVPGPAVCASC